MTSNLPTGVNERDIPGNRPIDDTFERVFNQLPIRIIDQIDSGSKKGAALESAYGSWWK